MSVTSRKGSRWLRAAYKPLAMLLALALASAPAAAKPPRDGKWNDGARDNGARERRDDGNNARSDRRPRETTQGGGLSMDEAVARAQRMTGGRVLSAGVVESDGRLLYRIKVLTPEGRVRTLFMDAGAGR